MGTVLRMNALNQINEGTVFLKKGDPVFCIGIVMKGSVLVKSHGISRIAKKGDMVAVSDLFSDQYIGDYSALEDTILYAFSVKNEKQLNDFLGSNAEYRGIIVYSIAKELAEYLGEREKLLKIAENMHDYFEGEEDRNPKQLFCLKCDKKKVCNYREYADVFLEIHKKYYYNSKNMAFYQTEEIFKIIWEVLESSLGLVKYLDEIYMAEKGEHLVTDHMTANPEYLQDKFDAMIEEKKESSEKEEKEGVGILDLSSLLKNSLPQILKFAKIEGNEKKEIVSAINDFVNAKDRLSTQDDMRKLKKQITTYFFKIYEICVFKWFKDKNVPLAVDLFLNYGYMDERLLDEEQIQFLYEMSQIKPEKLACRIYTMPEWLKEIYKGKKEPSRNSFEQDYRDWLREEKRSGNISEQQEKDFLENYEKRVSFEINNMFISNNKIVNGKLSTYVPILYKDEIYGHLDRMYLTKKKLCEAILELEKKDFTIFQREVLYTNPELKIEKEYVLKHVYPDVILAPVYGTASSMWQEITGKKRDTPGRFIFPVITENEVEKLVTKAFGRFHWEYCRCEQGAAWNNIQYKSLTSEYMDYIQYYRKNRDLTEEKREKIKAQILKARNNSREIFLIDYELWIYYESKAALKLNKVARLILATYCPFSKEIREKLKTNAAFEEALMKHQRNFGEKKREWEMRIKRRENKNLEVPKEFYDTYNYYANN